MNQETALAIEHLKKGNVILYPTDTIWGLGCDPYNEAAVKKIFEIKKRPANQPLILIVDSIQMLKTIVPRLHPHLEDILYYNIRPLTLIYDQVKKKFAPGVSAPNGSLAIRIVHNKNCQNLLSNFGGPIVSTSANIHTKSFPKSKDEIHPEILKQVDYLYTPSEFEENPSEAEPSLIARYCQNKKELIFLRT